jgi:glyoxylase-like metal-dependent hydrolase (beta-lactamase superfamily II)
MIEDLGSGAYLIDTGLYRPQHTGCYLVEDDGELAVIDSGVNGSVPRILDAIAEIGAEPAQVRYVMPTHVHLDHAGGAGRLMQACANATMVVHPKGLPHMIDPSKLQAGATAVYGEQAFQRDFGDLVPVAAAHAVAAADGEGFALGGRTLQTVHTPGHANHHACIFDSHSGYLFTGDTFGLGYRELRRDGEPLLVATTTPVAFDPAAWFDSLERMLALHPAACCLTHFGKVDEPQRHAAMLRASIQAHADLALAEEPHDPAGREQRLHDAVARLLIEAGTAHSGLAATEVEEVLAPDIELNTQGLGVWLARRAKRRG